MEMKTTSILLSIILSLLCRWRPGWKCRTAITLMWPKEKKEEFQKTISV